MAWIESHQSLRRHPKLSRLCKALGIAPLCAIGHLHVLWWWAIDYAKDGILTGCTPTEISEAAEWPGDPDVFLDAMIGSTFIDRKEGSMTLHDWHEYRLHYDDARRKIEDKRDKVRQRVQKFRITKRGLADCNASVTLSVTPPVTLGNAHVTPKSPHNQNNQNNQHDQTDRTKPSKPQASPLGFDAFWALYPRKKSKQEAVTVWNRLKHEGNLPALPDLLAAVTVAAKSEEWTKEGGKFVTYPHRWLRGHCWEDEILEADTPQARFLREAAKIDAAKSKP